MKKRLISKYGINIDGDETNSQSSDNKYGFKLFYPRTIESDTNEVKVPLNNRTIHEILMNKDRAYGRYSNANVIPDEDIKNGAGYLYGIRKLSIVNGTYDLTMPIYTDNAGHYYSWVRPEYQHLVTELPKDRKRGGLLPKRDYIPTQAETLEKIPMIVDYIKHVADSVGTNPNLVLERYAEEGPLDYIQSGYNEVINSTDQPEYFDRINSLDYNNDNHNANIGLNHLAEELSKGLIALDYEEHPEDYDIYRAPNGKINYIIPGTHKGMIKAAAAYIKYLYEEMSRQGYPKNGISLDEAVNTAYNRGTNASVLKTNPEFVRKNYNVPDYYGINKRLGGRSSGLIYR